MQIVRVLVGAILEWRSLHVVAIIQKDEVVAQFGFHLFEDKGVVGKFVVTSVSVSGFHKSQSGFFR